MKNVGVEIFVGIFGDYPIPKKFRGCVVKKDGSVDERYRKSKSLLEWVEKTDVPDLDKIFNGALRCLTK